MQAAREIAAELSGVSSVARLARKYLPKRSSQFLKARAALKRKFKPRRYAPMLVDRSAPPATGSTRQVQATGVSTVTQRILNISQPSWPAQGSNITSRLGCNVKLSGMKVCEQFENLQNYPIVVHYAIVQQKREDTDLKLDFFRDGTTTTGRTINFADTVIGSTTYDFKYDCASLNSDKWYVLVHQKKALSASTEGDVMKKAWKFDKYLNFKGQNFVFENAADTQPQKALYFLIWWQPMFSTNWSNVGPLPTIVRSSSSTLYYRPSVS